MANQKTALSSQEVCAILEAGAKNGVSVLKFGDLLVRFGRHATPTTAIPEPATTATVTPETHEAQTKDTLEVEELRLREQELAELQITDPLKYEQMLEDGDLDEESVDEPDDE